MVYRRDVSCKNEQIQKMMEEMKKSTTQATEDLVGAICQLEKDIDDEFQVTTQLKNGTEKLITKLGDDKNSHYVDEVEDLLGNVRMIQCYQLSHFQMMNELATKYRGQIRSIQLLHTTIIEGVTNMQWVWLFAVHCLITGYGSNSVCTVREDSSKIEDFQNIILNSPFLLFANGFLAVIRNR